MGWLRSSQGPNEEQYRLGVCRKCGQHSANNLLITCSLCATQYHPKCLSLSADKISRCANLWSCHKCRHCQYCGKKYCKLSKSFSSDKMIVCVEFDLSQHLSCIEKFDKSFDKFSANDLRDYCVCNKCEINSDDYGLDQQSVDDNNSDEEVDEEDSGVGDSSEENSSQELNQNNEEESDDNNEDNSINDNKSKKRTRTKRQKSKSAPQRLTRSMTKQSFDPTIASTSNQELESEMASDDENYSTTASITRRMSASGKRKRNKRSIDF